MIAAAALLLAAAATPSPAKPRSATRTAARPAEASAAQPSSWSPRRITLADPIPAATVTVKAGETLGHVAIRARAGTMAIAKANDLAPPYRLGPGRRLSVPAGRYHLVRDGEAGIAIARAYGVPWARIVAGNGLPEPYQLRAGERLLIPDPPPGRPRTMEERAAAFRLDIQDILSGGEPALAPREKPAPPSRAGNRAPPPDTPLAPPPKALAGRFAWPLEGEVVTRFGPQPDGRRSDGIVIRGRSAAAIRAAADGIVAYAGRDLPAYRGLVLVRHGGGWITAYAYAATLSVKRGQAVKQGQALGKAGAKDPRVLFQLRRARAAVDPLPQLPAATDESR